MKAIIYTIGMSICLIVGCQPSVNQGLTYDEYIKKAEQTLKEKNREKAILYYQKALELRPSDTNTHYILGELYDQEYQASYEEATRKRMFQILAHPDPNRKYYNDSPKELKPYGLKVGYDERAIQEFSAVMKYDGNNWQARYRIATDHLNKKRFQAAIEEYKKVIQLNPEYINAYSLIAESYKEIGSFDLAVDNLKTAIKKSPNFDDHDYYKLALVYRKINKGEKTAEIFKLLKDTKSPYFDMLRRDLYN